MALLGNYYLFDKAPLRHRGGATLSDSRASYSNSGSNRNQYLGAFFNYCSSPNGYMHPYAMIMAPQAGGLASYRSLTAEVSTTNLALVSGINATANLTASFNISNAQLDQIVSLIAAITASFNVTNAQLAAVAGIEASITASMSISTADLGAIVSMVASLSGSMTSDLSIFATALMSSDIGGATPLSPEGLAGSLLDNNDIETGYSMRESLRLILSALSGKVSGAGTSTISIRDINDTVDRIIATVDTNGNRSSITIDKD